MWSTAADRTSRDGLDVTTRAQILDLLRKLQRERGMAIMLITLGITARSP